MKLGPIMDRAKAASLGFKTIDGVEAVADLETLQAPLPGLFFVPATEDSTNEQNGPGLIVDLVTVSFDAVIIVGGAAQRGRVRDELAQFAHDVRTCLFGFTPAADGHASDYRPITYAGGRLLGVGAGRVSWIQRYQTFHRLRFPN